MMTKMSKLMRRIQAYDLHGLRPGGDFGVSLIQWFAGAWPAYR